MKPDGVATVQSEPMEAEGTEPVTEPTGSDSASQNGATQSPPQHDEPQNEQAAPPNVKEASGKAVDAKSKSKGPIKGKTTAAGPATTGAGTRPKVTQSRLATNGLTKTTASTLTKKPIPATNAAADKKKPTTTSGPSALNKKPVGSSTAIATSRPQPKVTNVGISRSTTTTTAAGTKTGTGVGTASGLSRRPATAATSAATKPKSTAPAPRPATAPAAKPSTSATAKATAAPKTNRSTVNSAPRPAATSTTAGRATTTTTTAVTRTSRTATQPVKPLVSASAARKDVGKTNTTAPGKKTVASTLSRPAASKSLNSDAPKSAAPSKRPPPATKAPQLKPDDKKSVPTRKVPPSPRNNPSRPASGKNIAASPNHKQAGTISGKLQQTKPTQSVLPLVVKGKPSDKENVAKPDNEEPATDPVQLSAAAVATVAVATAAAVASEEFSSEPEAATSTAESSLHAPTSSLDVEENVDLQLPNVNHQNVPDDPTTGPETQEVLLETDFVKEAGLKSSVVSQESEELMTRKADEKLIAAVAPVSQEVPEQETTVPLFDISAATVVPSGVEVAEKTEPTNSECIEDVEEEEREGSQQVSLSEMSGTQPTEESRPGSAGLAGSVWRAGALLSELDSEDVSCSQQGASELSAPGVLEGTESMDDLGDASLKGADGEGASVGSPDFEKVPDILNNEDDDDDDEEDRVCDMDVGSERAEDSHRQLHDNDEDEDDEDVEMASEGITESGLESYGNADEDDLTEDYRLDNLNRIQPPIIPSAPQWNQPSCFADAWAQPPQPASTLLTSPSSECWQADPETPTEKPAQSRIDVGSEVGSSSPLPSNLFEPPPSSPELATLTGAEGDPGPKPVLTPSQASELHAGIPSEPDLATETDRDTITPEKVEDCNNFGIETNSKEELQQEPLNPVPTVLPDIMQDLGIHLDCADEEQPETLPAEDVLGGPATAPSSSSATEDEASDTEGEMQISDPQAELPGIESAFGIAPVGHNLSTLEEHEEVGGENEVGGGGGSETPQSATSAASYGFDYMTSNSNAQSSAESCSKSPGIFSLENEEQLPDEAKDPSLLKELTLISAAESGEKIDPVNCQHGEFQANPEHQYMLCGESRELPESDSVPGTVPVKSDLTDPSPQHLEEEQDPETQHPYYSTICEKTDSPLAERNFPPQPNDLLSIQMTMSSKLRLRPRASHVPQAPRLPTDLPPRIPNAVSNTQLRCLEQHQQHLHEIQQRQEKRNREQEKQQAKEEVQVRKEKQEEEEEEQRRNLLELKLKQQEQELKQRQQIMQWQQELEEQQQQQQQQQKHKVQTPVILSPLTGLTTIYETVETSDSEDGEEEGGEKLVEELQDKSSFIVFPGEDAQRCTEKNDSANLYSHCTTPSPESATQDLQQELKETATDQDSPSPLGSPEQPPPLEFDWGKKVDIVQQLINQTLLLTGDGCSPLLLLPGRAGGTLSPLESSMWPNLLPPLTPPSATVTSVSSFSPEAPGSSAQGEWTVVELETHH